MTASYQVHGDVAVITLDNPPVNGLGLATRQGIVAGLAKAQADAGVKAIVLGEFIGGNEADGVNRIHWAFENLARDLRIPIFTGLPVGHGARNLPLLVGATAELTGKELRCAPLS